MDILNALKENKIRITFTEEVLGTASGDPELHDTYIASKAPDAMSREEEVAALGVGDVVEKGMTQFPRDENGQPYVWDYQVRGYMKESIKIVKKHFPKSECAKVKANKMTVDNAIFVSPRKIPIHFPADNRHIGDCQRPLRASTAQGERIAIAHSETIPAGSYIDISVVLCPELGKGINAKEVVRECFDYGRLKGFGQWRNSGKGRFVWDWRDE